MTDYGTPPADVWVAFVGGSKKRHHQSRRCANRQARLIRPARSIDGFSPTAYPFRTVRSIASVIREVVAAPPRSGVCSSGFAVTVSIAFISRWAALFSPKCSSIIAPLQNVPIGFAIPLPAISKAEPWIGSNIEGNRRSGFKLAVGLSPIEPVKAAARSDRMSAWRLLATIVSIVSGCRTMRTVIASTSIRSHATSGNSRATSRAISSQSTKPNCCAFDFVTIVSFFRRRALAVANANRMIL